jgi:hypothetical protein
MRKVFALGVCLCLATAAWASNTTQPIDQTNPVVEPWVPPLHGGPGISGVQKVSARMTATGGPVLQYGALTLDDDGGGNLFIKIQAQNSSVLFNFIGMYSGNSSPGWPGQTGGAAFFALPVPLASCTFTVTHDGAGNVTLDITDTDPPGNDVSFVRGGWTPRNGAEYGIGGFASIAAIDDFSIGDSLCDDFNRANGPLGPDWVQRNGGGTGIVDNTARQGPPNGSRSGFIGECGGGNNCVYTLSKSKAKGGCDTCPDRGSDYRTESVCEGPEDCAKKLKTSITCPEGGGTCKLKGKGARCE